jgi:hypothetical protein
MNIEILPQPPFPLDGAAEKFRADANKRWAAIQKKKAPIESESRALDATLPEEMDKPFFERLATVRAKLAEAGRQEIPLLREILSEWPAMLKACWDARKLATERAYASAVAEIKSKLEAMGFPDRPGEAGFLQLHVLANGSSRVKPLLAAKMDAAGPMPHFDTRVIQELIGAAERALRQQAA